jgi:hypothetical protein
MTTPTVAATAIYKHREKEEGKGKEGRRQRKGRKKGSTFG